MIRRLSLLFFGVFGLLAQSAFAQNTALVMDSDPGEYLGQGQSYYYTPTDGTFQAQKNFGNGVQITFSDPTFNNWTLNFAGPDGDPLAVQVYDNASHFPFMPPGVPGLDLSGHGRGCSQTPGRFEVKQIVYGSGNTIVSFHATFTLRCDGEEPSLTGEVLYSSNDPLPPFNRITSTLSVFATRNQPFQYQIRASNSPSAFTATGLPAGLAVNSSSGLISGTPTAEGQFSVALTATGVTGTASGTLALTIDPPGQSTGPYTALFMTSDAGDYIGQGQNYLYRTLDGQFDAFSNGFSLVTISFETPNFTHNWFLPFNSPTGTVMGVGTYLGATRSASASNPGIDIGGDARGCNSTTGEFEVKEITFTNGNMVSYRASFVQHCEGVVPALHGEVWYNSTHAITSDPVPLAMRGQPFSYQIVANNAPTGFNASALPTGLSVNTTTGIISGTPTMGGKFSIPISATGSNGTIEDRITLTVALPAEPTPAPVISSARTATGQVNQTFSYQIAASNSPAQFAASGLPTGLTLTPGTGLISGTPTVTGTFDVVISASNTGGVGGSSLTLSIYPPPPVINSANSATTIRSQPFSFQVTATNEPTGFSMDGQPSELTLNATGGLLSGTPTQAGVYHIVLRATNGSGTTFQDFTLTVAAPTPTPSPSPSPTPNPTPPPSALLGNLSTRLRVETGDNVLIGGFIVTGTQPKKVIVRAIGPSLTVTGALADPILELHDSSGTLIDSNDNWRSDHEAEISATGVAPTNDLESAIVATLPANNASYTAVVRGVDNGAGVGLVEVYDLDQLVDSRLGNISTRGLVQTNENVLIAGTIVLGPGSRKVLVRAIGPSLSVAGKLADPVLELRDGNGTLLRSNDNWRSDQETEIVATTIPPPDDLEAAIVETLPANGAAYTAIVSGVNGTTGVGLVEVYALP